MQNKPNFRNVQMIVTLAKTRNYNNEQRTMYYSKQTQSNPILSAVALAKADSKDSRAFGFKHFALRGAKKICENM